MANRSSGDARALYHRWRSRSFSEVVAQEHVTRTLRNAVASGRIVHAYLFCGPRGTGKTSTARILAKAVNCLDPRDGEPCNLCPSCTAVADGRAIDLIEIDAASNRGIDDARDLREKIRFSPSEARYKVYIIDEAHMLTSEASNALLKTLEEPPEHAILILATTESHKILPTIVSRCQRFDFRRIPLQSIVEQLEMIRESEGLEVEAGVLERVARMARGSLRDAESLLDQLVAYCGQRIDLASARESLALTGEELVPRLAEALRVRELAVGFRLIDEAASAGADLRHFSRELVDHLRALMLAKSGAGTSLVREFRADEWARLRASAEGWDYRQLLSAIKGFGDLEGRMRLEPFNQSHLEMAFAEVALAGGVESLASAAPEALVSPTSPSKPVSPVAPAAVRPDDDDGSATLPTLSRGGKEMAPAAASAGDQLPVVAPPAPGSHVEEMEAWPSGSSEGKEAGAPPAADSTAKLELASLLREWPRVRNELGASGSIMAATCLEGCQPVEVSGDTVTFGFASETLRKSVEMLGVRDKVAESLARLFGARVGVRFVYGVKLDRGRGRSDADPVVDAAVREFGFRIKRVETPPDRRPHT